MVHHADVAQAVLRAIRTPGVDGRAYNIGGDAGSRVYELHELVGRTMDVAATAGRSVPDPWFGFLDTTRAYRELAFSPMFPTPRAAWRAGAL